MTRDIGTVNLAEAAANGSYEVLFAEMVISDTDIIRLSTLFQPVTFMTQDNTSQTFEGAGHLLNVSAVNDSIDVKQTSVNLTLTALDSVVINQVTNTPFIIIDNTSPQNIRSGSKRACFLIPVASVDSYFAA